MCGMWAEDQKEEEGATEQLVHFRTCIMTIVEFLSHCRPG